MKKTTLHFLFGLILLSDFSFGFIPPVTGLIRQVVDGRRGGSASEVVLRHRISESICEERVVNAQGKYFFLWSCPTGTETVAGNFEGNQLSVGTEKRAGHSQAFWSYYFAPSSESLRNSLLAERFINRRQLAQFETDLDFALEPHQWKIKDFYIRHPDVSLKMLGGEVVGEFIGSKAENRAVSFSRNGEGISQFQWQGSDGIVSIRLNQFSKLSQDGLYARRQFYSISGKEMFSSEFVSKTRLTDKQAAQWLSNWKSIRQRGSNPSDNLNMLLRFR